MTLTRTQRRAHREVCELLRKETLSDDERIQVLEHFHEGGDVDNRSCGAYFTPPDLARDFVIDVGGSIILDLCAGIGALSFAYKHFRSWDEKVTLVCVEQCARYVEVGKKVLPEAEWICGNIFDLRLQEQLKRRRFDSVISNPPFGRSAMNGNTAPRYRGGLFEYAVLDVGATFAECGTFIIPQASSPFLFSGVQCYQDLRRDPDSQKLREYRRFAEATGLDLQAGCGVDTTQHQQGWKGVSPVVEIVTFEQFTDQHVGEAGLDSSGEQLALFE